MKRFLEWYFGVPPADAGQGTAWNFQYKTPWPTWLPDWAVLLLAAAVVGYVGWVYLRDARGLGWPKRAGLIALRLASVGLLVLFLTEVTLSVDRTGLPVVVVLIDDSASMNFEDQYPDEWVAAKVKQLLAEGKFDRPSRINLTRAVLSRHNGSFLRQVQRKHKLRVYRFSETAVPLGRGEYLHARELDELVAHIGDMQARGDQTRPGPAVRKVLEDLRGTPPSAIIVFTDGIASTTDADRLSGVAELARGRLVPVFAVGVGSEEPARDVQLYDMLVDEVVFVDDPIAFSAKVKAYGFKGEAVTVTLRQKDSKRVLAETTVRAGADGQPVPVELIHTPTEEGEFEYVVEATPLPQETDVNNNREIRTVSVRREKLRVLLADSAPRYEFRYLKHLLERDRTIELTTVLQEADLEYSDADATAVRHFPVKREDLFKFDVVIFGDLNPADLSDAVLENLREFVREAGGGVIVVSGQSYTPLAYRGTPLEVMLPVQLAGAKVPPADAAIREGFRPDLTVAGRRGTSIFRFAERDDESLAVWRRLPELYWLCETPEIKPGAEVFAEHPTRGGAERKLPVIALQRYGAGKVLFHATDDLWRWRFRVGDLYYGRYWVQAIRYLSRSKLLGRDRTALLDTDRTDYRQGDTVLLRLRFFDEKLVPVENDGVTVLVERRGDVERPVQLTRLPQSPNVFEGQFPRASEGSYRAWVATPAFPSAPPSKDFLVEASDRELQQRSLDRADLVQTARRTHGKYYSIAEADQLPADLPAGQPVPLETQDPIPLWNRWELMLMFAMLLASEWLLRKRFRLV